MIYTDNQFLNATDNSYRLALHIGRQHLDALHAHNSDPFILGLENFFRPLYLSMDGNFDQFVMAGGLREGNTLNVRQTARLLSGTKARAWDIAIQNVYPVGTPQYMSLLPDRRTPFQQGPLLLRINAINSLSLAIGTDVALAAVKLDVDNFFNLIDGIYSTQQGSKSTVKTLSDAVEASRVDMCWGMYANCGGLMQHFSPNADQILPFFDSGALMRGQQIVFTNYVPKQGIHFIVEHTFGAGDFVEFENDGNTTLRFYLAQQKDDPIGAVFLELAPHTRQTVLASVAGLLTDHFLQVYNPDPNQKGHFTIDLNPPTP